MSTTLYELAGPWKGRLAIAARPRGGEWLEDDVRALRLAGVDVLISALTEDERAELALMEEEGVSRARGLDYISFPIQDRGVPASMPAAAQLVQWVQSHLDSGKTVAIHCRSAIGRSSMLAAAVLTASGTAVDAAFQEIEKARGLSVPDTPEQQAWVEMFRRSKVGRPERAAS